MRCMTWQRSSVNRRVVGSSPTGGVEERPAKEAVAQSLGAGLFYCRGGDADGCDLRSEVRSAGRPATSSGGQWFRCLRLRVGVPGAPEFEQVVSGCDQLPFGLAGGEAAAQEAIGSANAFRVREDRLDDLLASAVERLPFRFREHRLDPARFVALAG